MTGLGTLLKWDFILQYRQKLWLAGAVISLVWIGLLSLVFKRFSDTWVPAILFSDVSVIGLLFISGMVFFERGQGSIEAFAVTPVATGVWLLSKLVSLTALTAVVSLLIALTEWEAFNWPALLIAVILNGALNTLIGFLIAAPFRKMTDYFLVMSMTLGTLSWPIFWYFGIVDHPLLWLVPSQPGMYLLKVAFEGVAPASFLGAAALMLLWIALAFYLGIRAFHRFISPRHGTLKHAG